LCLFIELTPEKHGNPLEIVKDNSSRVSTAGESIIAARNAPPSYSNPAPPPNEM